MDIGARRQRPYGPGAHLRTARPHLPGTWGTVLPRRQRTHLRSGTARLRTAIMTHGRHGVIDPHGARSHWGPVSGRRSLRGGKGPASGKQQQRKRRRRSA